MKPTMTLWILGISLLTLILAGCPGPPLIEHAPRIQAVSANPATASIGGQVSLGVAASDQDNDSLTYRWSASAGAFNQTTGANVIWTAPGQAGTATITVTAVDGSNLSDTQTLAIAVEQGDLQVQALTATGQQNSVNLNWQNPADGRFSQVVVRASNSSTPMTLADGREIYKGPGTSFLHQTYDNAPLVAGTTYYYSIWVIDQESAVSSLRVSSSAVPTALPAVPAVPVNLAVTVASSTELDLTWSQGSSNTQNYIVQRSTAGGSFAAVGGVLPATQTSYADVGLVPSTNYTYRVVARNSVGDSAPSPPAAGSTAAPSAAPSAPTALTLGSLSAMSATMSWVDNSDNEAGFKVYRRINASNETVTAVAAGQTSYTENSLSPATAYTFEVRAYNASGDSTATNVLAIDTSVPTAPGSLQATSAATSVTLTWTDSTAETAYVIDRGPSASGPWTNLTSALTAGSIQYVDSGLETGETYYYRIKAANLFGSSAYAAAQAQTGLPTGSWGTHSWDQALWGN